MTSAEQKQNQRVINAIREIFGKSPLYASPRDTEGTAMSSATLDRSTASVMGVGDDCGVLRRPK